MLVMTIPFRSTRRRCCTLRPYSRSRTALPRRRVVEPRERHAPVKTGLFAAVRRPTPAKLDPCLVRITLSTLRLLLLTMAPAEAVCSHAASKSVGPSSMMFCAEIPTNWTPAMLLVAVVLRRLDATDEHRGLLEPPEVPR